MPRLILLWNRPAHLSDDDAAGWARREAHRLAAIPGVVGGRLTRLQRASAHDRPAGDWMLELDLAADADGRACVEAPQCREWLADLCLLGMQPSAVFADDGDRLQGART